jgi:hypothetical protein
MKTLYNILLTISLLSVALTSCNKDDNSRLEGKWQMQTVESNGVTEKVDTIYYNFQTSLFQYQIYNPNTDSMRHSYGFKVLDNNILSLELTAYPNPTGVFLPHTDWESIRRDFYIERLTNSTLILKSEDKKYTFRKF